VALQNLRQARAADFFLTFNQECDAQGKIRIFLKYPSHCSHVGHHGALVVSHAAPVQARPFQGRFKCR
jgi:hypothetical protein